MPYAVKKLAQFLLEPVSLVHIALYCGLAALMFRRTRRFGKIALAACAAMAAVFGSGALNGALERLERKHPPFPVGDVAYRESLRGADVVVLGQGLSAADLPVRFRDCDCFRNRMNEGARVCRAIEGSRMIVSMGGRTAADSDKRDAIAEYAATYGLATNRIVFFSHARDTAEEAAASLAIAGTNRVVLVTSAAHMERALRIFAKRGASPVPAPCDYRYPDGGAGWLACPAIFGAHNFLRAERLLHEYLGLAHEAVF